LRDNLQLNEQSSDIEPLARTVKDNSVMFTLCQLFQVCSPLTGVSDARGVIVGLTRYRIVVISREPFWNQQLFNTREVLDAMESDSGVKLTNLKVDGGMDQTTSFSCNSRLISWMCQLVKPRIIETNCPGAAYAAGLAVGFWKNLDELSANWGRDKKWTPAMDGETRSRLYTRWKKAVSRTFEWL
jgi:glycerol kinase